MGNSSRPLGCRWCPYTRAKRASDCLNAILGRAEQIKGCLLRFWHKGRNGAVVIDVPYERRLQEVTTHAI